MKDIRAAFAQFWGSFLNRSKDPAIQLKAYQSGYAEEFNGKTMVPAKRPYITYELGRAAFADWTILSGYIWTQDLMSWGLVDDVMQQAAEKVPEEGTALPVSGGGLWLLRSTPFCDYLPPEDGDPKNKAGAIRLVVKNFII